MMWCTIEGRPGLPRNPLTYRTAVSGQSSTKQRYSSGECVGENSVGMASVMSARESSKSSSRWAASSRPKRRTALSVQLDSYWPARW